MKNVIKRNYSLSYGQEAMWLLYQIAPESVAYNIFITAKINACLNIATFHHVWKKIIKNHPILKTTYTNYEGKPVQEVNQQQNFVVELIDTSNWDENELKENILAIADRPFNLEKDAVLRVHLFTRSAEEHILLLTMHHIAGDMWSYDILLREFQTLYAQEIGKVSQEQTEAQDVLTNSKSYVDFVNWQSEMLSGSRGEKQWQYWQQQLAGELPILNLHPDKPRPPLQTYRGASHIIKLDEQLTQKLQHLASTFGTSLYQILLTAFYIQLYRYTNQTDILVGSPMRGRPGKEFKEIVGYFSNLTVLRVSVPENATFTELLTQVSKTVRQAQKHQDYPFFLLAEQLQPQRDPSCHPLCQVSFTWQAQTWCEPTDHDLHRQQPVLPMQPYLLGQRGAQMDLSLMVREAQGALEPCWQYNTDLFEAATIERMAGHFVTLLEGIVTNPSQSISQLPLLTQFEQHQLLLEWNNNQADYPRDKCIHQLFEEQVEKTPDAVAVVFADERLTYYELNCRANQLANYLQTLGVKPDTLVGICVERSLEMVVGLLGIHKTGGAYVPLDPEYPLERLSFILEDAQVAVLLTQQRFVQTLHTASGHQAQIVCLDTDWESISASSKENGIASVQADNLAYVIYTSGSTGKPKGVLVNHANVARLFAATEAWYNFNCDDVWTMFHSYAFDFSVWEIWGALLYGGRLVVVPYLVTRNPESFYQLLCQEKVTVLNQTPSAFRQLIQAEQSMTTAGDLSLRLVIFGGEALELSSLQPWFERHGDTSPQLVNMYGITETTVHVTYRPLSKADLQSTASVIGRPIPDLQVYLLDQNLQPVPIGVRGEMYVGGAGVTRGYLNRCELTQQRFISNPFAQTPGSKLYRTGDNARYLPNGELEYLGRIDNQVKIRGFRIELGEIEGSLAQHPSVWENVVIVREDEPGDKRLVAYVAPKAEQPVTVQELRFFLDNQLPSYMIPNAFVLLESLPLTSNGKIDRRALPAPDLDSTQLEKFVGPRTPTEEMLAQIWTQVLKVELVGIHDNFFELGGHSLLATQLVSRIRNIFKVELPLREFFTNATVAELARSLQQLQQTDIALTSPPIVKRSENANLPLSFAQQRLWFLDQLEPNSPFYNIPITLRLTGSLNIAALEHSIQAIIARHEALRTNFITVDGQATQVIREQVMEDREQGLISVVDLQHLPLTEQQIAVEELAQEHALQPFDLATQALVRVKLLLLNEKENVLLVCLHHIVSDGWSMGVFVKELGALYDAYTQGQSSALAPLPIQYADFALWQRQWLVGEVLQSQISYWLQQLQDAATFLPLPTDRPRPAVQTFAGAHHEFALSAGLTQKLTKLSQQQGCTLFMTLLAAYDTLLYRYTGQTDILVGTPIANRDRSQIEGLIGFFVNTLVMRTNLAGNPSFSELLGRVREMAMSAYTHQHLPFEMLVEALQPERNLSHTPLFQVMFVLENAPTSQVQLAELTVTSLMVESATAKFDLTLSMQNTDDGLLGVWEYNTDLFDASTIERLRSHFVTLLEAIVTNPQERICHLPLLTQPEQRQLLVEWNDTGADYPQDTCIHELFEAQVQRTPDAVAVVFNNQQLTYHELNCQANKLAHYLHSLGVKPDTLVGLCVERSLEMVVGMLGILKAGGAYVPLDPEYLTERLSFMLEDAAVGVLLTQTPLMEKLPQHQAKVVCLDQVWSKIAQNNQHNLKTGVRAFNLANLIYTSGSTGKPKGVLVEHQGLSNLAPAQIQTFGIDSDSRILQFASFSFDASISEILMALGSGASLYLGTKDSIMPGQPLIEQLRTHGITHITLPPSALAVMPVVKLPALQTIIVAGEACSPDLIRQWSVGRNFFNAYGPTEASVCATIAKCHDHEKITIGRPIANKQIYILDEHLQPVPVGVPGELYIGGVGVARGYLNRTELTQEKFITNPFNADEHSRLYKTGDLARYLADGTIEYLGRIDNQVKIRGFRIELGEIEAALSQHDDVQNCCVIVREDTPGEKSLVAYIVLHQQGTTTMGKLRQFLTGKLPDYMIPNAFVLLAEMPLTPNGKVDRRALPAPELSSTSTDKYTAPRNAIEELLAQIWAQVLKVELVGIHDNFFELGGHSLLATQLVSRIRNIFKVELPLRELYAASTVAELALLIQQLQQQDLELIASPIIPRAENTEIPLSFAQQRLWFLDQLEPSSAFYNLPVALRFVGNLNVAALEQSLREIIHRHEALRTNFITVDGKTTQVIREQGTISFVDWQHLPVTEQEIATQQLIQQQTQQPFDLATEPLIRVTLVLLSETEQVLIVCMHHIVSDGWSIGVFFEELTTLYNAYSQGQSSVQDATPTALAPLPIQYADFALWQRQWLVGNVLQTQLSYWQQQLKDAPALLSLPTDRPRPAQQTFNGAHFEFALSEELTQSLLKLSQQQGCTLFMTLLAAYNTLLYRYTGQADILVGTPIANRDRTEIEGLIGFFINTLVMRTDLSGNPSFSELLGRVREVALGAYSHQNLPFEMLVEALQPQRDLSHTPLFQVMFILQNAPMSELSLTGLSVTPLILESATAKFDLTLSMHNTADRLMGVWEYNTDLFDAGTIERMAGHFVTLLQGIITNTQQQISQLPLLTEIEQHQLLVGWNDTQADYPQDKCIHQLFEEQVQRTPDAIAVVLENQQLTYHQLNCRANQLAHYLKTLGVGADVLVGLFVERSLEMIVGLLGILKAGGAYVPLDPDYPTERLTYMYKDAAVPVVLTQQRLLERLPDQQAQPVLLDTDWDLISQFSQDNPLTEIQITNLAYVIYTSGSTGQPKGVQALHQGAVNRFHWMWQNYPFMAGEICCQKTSLNFVDSVWEIFGPLLQGVSLVILPDQVVKNPQQFVLTLASHQVTRLLVVPSLLRVLLATNNELELQLPQLKLWVTSGEALSAELLEEFRRVLPNSTLLNLYGSSEVAADVTCWCIEPQTPISKVSIGKAIANTQIYILDQQQQPVPIGVPGELYVGGTGLARGYLNQPEMTTQKFILNPFDHAKWHRLYKTEDLARYLGDGNIEYLGRIDNQVKVRGFRIELGEIEAVLNQHDDVQASCVIALEDTPDDKRLVAYVVLHQHSLLTIYELQQYLKAKLPPYMEPNAIIILESLPLTPNGKVDRRSLPAPSISSDWERFVPPRNQVELQLTQIWSRILKVDRVGVKDNFFDLGGHSLLTPYLIAQIKQQFGKDIALASLYQNPTIEQLVTLVQQNSDLASESPLVALQQHGSQPPIFCVPGAAGYPFYFYDLARCLGQDQPFYSFQANIIGEEKPVIQIEDVAAQYIQAILTVQPQGPYFLGGHSFGGKVAFEMAQQLLRQGHQVALVAIIDIPAPFAQEKPTNIDWDNTDYLADLVGTIQVVYSKNIECSVDTLRSMVWEDQLKYVLERLKNANILPPDGEITHLDNMVQLLKANSLVKYLPQEVYPSKITLLRASETSFEGFTNHFPSEILEDLAWGWNKFSAQPVDVHFVPGNHMTMMNQPHVQVLAERLQACIEQSQTDTIS